MFSGLPVFAARITTFPGVELPWIEVWFKKESECGVTYPYLDVFRPQGYTDAQWWWLLGTGTSTMMEQVK